MGRNIELEVIPEKLDEVADQLKTLSDGYRSTREKMYSEVTALSSKWQGGDNKVFTDKINGALDSLQVMINALQKAAANLESQSRLYKKQQDDVIRGLQ